MRKTIPSISAGDRAFFQRFYEENKNFIYYIARQYASDSPNCDDIVQDAAIRLMRNIPALKELNRNKTAKYIAATVKTVFIDHKRKQNRENAVMFDNDFSNFSFCDQLYQQDLDLFLSNNLSISKLKMELSARDWMVLECKYLLGYSQQEISELIGVSPDSVRMILHRAKKKARVILEQDAIKGGDHIG